MNDINKDGIDNDIYMKHKAIRQMLEAKEYRRFDQMSLAELESLVARLQGIIEQIEKRNEEQRPE